MRRLAVCLCLVCLILALAACSSAPVHFYTLMSPPSSAQDATPAAYAIAVMPVTIPAQVDRPQLVVREGGSRVSLLDGQRWIAPLGDEIRSALSADLTRALGVQDVYGISHDDGVPVYRVNVDVSRFESVPGQYTLLAATWAVDAAGGKSRATPCTVHIKESVGAGYAALADGHQRGLRALAKAIAGQVRSVAAGHTVSCPAATN